LKAGKRSYWPQNLDEQPAVACQPRSPTVPKMSHFFISLLHPKQSLSQSVCPGDTGTCGKEKKSFLKKRLFVCVQPSNTARNSTWTTKQHSTQLN
jgi:hypothetical protein